MEHKTASLPPWRRCKSWRYLRVSLRFAPSQDDKSIGFLKFHVLSNTALAAIWVTAALAGCTLLSPPAPAPAPSAEEACRAVRESLAAAVPPGESLDDLQARGLRVRTPLDFGPGALPRAAHAGGAAVRLMIDPEGHVVPGSPKTLKHIGELQIARAVEAAALSMSFEFEPGARPADAVALTAVYTACPRS